MEAAAVSAPEASLRAFRCQTCRTGSIFVEAAAPHVPAPTPEGCAGTSAEGAVTISIPTVIHAAAIPAGSARAAMGKSPVADLAAMRVPAATVVEQAVIAPVKAPSAEGPTETAKGSQRHTDPESNHSPGKIGGEIRNRESRIRSYRSAIHNPGIVFRHINDLRVRRGKVDVPLVVLHRELRRILQRAGRLRALAHGLDGV